MKIRLKLENRTEFFDIKVEKEISIKELVDKYEEQLSYRVLAARVNNSVEDLNFIVKNDCVIEFLDMRNQAANLIYQDSLIFIFLKSVNDIIGDLPLVVQNSLNKGLFIELSEDSYISDEEIIEISNRMKYLIENDLPIIKEHFDRSVAQKFFEESRQPERIDLLLGDNDENKNFNFYSLDGFKEFFYGLIVPSTAYIGNFELMRYKKGLLLRFAHPSNPDKIPEYVDEKMLYDTFGKQKKWGDLMKIKYVSDLNNIIQNDEYKELIQLSEALHERRIIEIADMITKEKKRIVLIAGPSSSGKTTFAQRLCIQLRVNGLEPLYLGTDDYFVERVDTPLDEYGEMNFEDLEAVDINLFNSNMNDLLSGKDVDLPTFDFMDGRKIYGKRLTKIESHQPIVIEGIHALNENLTGHIDKGEKFKIYISPLTQLNIDRHNRIVTTDHRMLRRMVRDFKYRGHSAQDTIASWAKVRKGEDKNIFPFSNEANVLFNSVHLYEISVLKKYAEPLLEAIKSNEPEFSEAVRMLNFLRFFKTIEDDSVIVNNSILREFIGGSIFVD